MEKSRRKTPANAALATSLTSPIFCPVWTVWAQPAEDRTPKANMQIWILCRDKSNVVPAKAIVRGDLRFISEAQKETARAKMREIVAKSLSGTTAKITFSDGIPAMSPTEGNYALLKQLDAVSQDLGFGKIEAQDPGERGAGDIAYIANLLPGLDGLGATGGKAHAKGEYADLDTMPRQIKRAALLIYRLTR